MPIHLFHINCFRFVLSSVSPLSSHPSPSMISSIHQLFILRPIFLRTFAPIPITPTPLPSTPPLPLLPLFRRRSHEGKVNGYSLIEQLRSIRTIDSRFGVRHRRVFNQYVALHEDNTSQFIFLPLKTPSLLLAEYVQPPANPSPITLMDRACRAIRSYRCIVHVP